MYNKLQIQMHKFQTMFLPNFDTDSSDNKFHFLQFPQYKEHFEAGSSSTLILLLLKIIKSQNIMNILSA
jgi:hypothetical protein